MNKLDLLFSLCRPSPTFVGINYNYRYDRARIVALEQLRHDYVHRGGLGVHLSQGEADLSFLHETDYFLTALLCLRYGLQLRPQPLLNAIGDVVMKGGDA